MSDDVNIAITSTFSGTGVNQAQKGMVDLNQSATEIVAGLRAAATASGASETEFLAMAGAASQAALQVGQAAKAEELLAVAMGQGAAATEEATVATMAQQNAAILVAQQHARAAVVTKDYVGALAILNEALVSNTGASAANVASLETQIVTVETAGTATGGLGAQVAMLANPFVIATAAIGAGVTVLKSFGDALDLTGKLQQESTAFGGIIGNFQEGNAILAEGTAIGKQYGFTQGEITDAFKNLAPIIRQSTSSTQEQTEALARMSVLDPANPVNALTHAIEGIKKGRFTELAGEMGLTKPAAAQLAKSVADGKDAFVALNDALDKQGISLDVARTRMEGLTGATNRQKQAAEDLALAQGKFAAGPGLALMEEQIKVTDGLTRTLSGDFDAMKGSIQTSIGSGIDSMSQWNPVANALSGVIGNLTGVTQAHAQATQQAAASVQYITDAMVAKVAVDDRATQAVQLLTLNMDAERQAAAQITPAISALTSARTMDTAAMVDSTAKTLESGVEAQKLAAFQATLANLGGQVAGGFITAGNAALAMASQYRMAYGDALALINAQAQLGMIKLNAQGLADQRAGERSGGSIRSQSELDSQTADRKLAADHARQLQAAEDQAAIAGAKNKNQKLAALQAELAHTTDDIQRVNIQSQIDQETSGGSKRAGAASAGASKLESIQETSGNKIAKIISDRDAKLAALDKKYADEQLENQRKLGNDIANLAGNRRVNDETDDLDLVGPHTKDEAQKLNDRERAEASARQRSEANAEEARKKAEAGDAESADKTLQIREAANQKQEDLDQKYYEKQAELGKNPELQAALKQQYDEATKAIQDQSDREVAQEDQMAQIKKDQRTKEHDDIILAATDAANVVIGQSQRMADGVVKATGIARAQASANLNAIGDAVKAIPSDKTITIHVNQDGSTDTVGKSTGSSGGSSGTKAAGGGDFVTHGPTTLTVGDNPGGVEAVSVTPVSGKGTTSVGAGMMKMAGGGTAVVDAGGGFTTPIATGTAAPSKGKASAAQTADALKSQIDEQKLVVDLLESLIKLREDLNAELQNGQPFNTAFVINLADRAASFLQIVLQRVVPITKKNGDAFTLYVTAAKDAIGILGDVADLRKKLTEDMDSQPFDTAQIVAFAWRAQQFLQIVESQLVPTTQAQADALSQYKDAESSAIAILKDVADLRKALADSIGPQPDLIAVSQLALTAAHITQIVEAQMLPTTEDQAKALSQYHDAAEASIGIIKDTSDLGKSLVDNAAPPIDLVTVQQLAATATQVTRIVQDTLQPTTDDQAKALQTWSDAVGAGVSVIKDVSDLGKTVSENATLPLDVPMVMTLAGDATRVTAIVQGTLTPTTEDQAKALQNWSDAVGAGVSIVKDVGSLTSAMFTDYVSPTDAQIGIIAKDAKRIADGLVSAASSYSTDGLTAAKSYADAVGSTFNAFKDGLLFFDALKSGDFQLDTGALSKFETSTLSTLDTAKRLGAVAATIPAGNLAALGATTKALSDQSEALIKLAAVPFGDLPGAAAGLASQSNALLAGARGDTTIYNTWQISGSDPNTVANLVLQKLNAQTASRR